MNEKEVAFALAQLRHLYKQLLEGHVVNQRAAAKHLLGPAVERLEKALTPGPARPQS